MITDVKIVNKPKEFELDSDYHVFLIKKIREDIDSEYYTDLLYRNTYKFLISQVMKYKHVTNDMEDLIQCGSISFMKALNSFDIDKGFNFVTLYATCIKNDIQMEYFKRGKNKETGKFEILRPKQLMLHEIIELDKQVDNNNGLISDIISDSSISIEQQIIYNDTIERFVDFVDNMKISERSRNIYKYYINIRLSGKLVTHREVGNKFGISTSYATRIINKCEKRIRNGFIKKYL